jgi:hypothetical protein
VLVVLAGVYLFNEVVRSGLEADPAQVVRAEVYLARHGEDVRLTECQIPPTGDKTVVHCRAHTRTGRVVPLRIDYRPDGSVAATCRTGTDGCP